MLSTTRVARKYKLFFFFSESHQSGKRERDLTVLCSVVGAKQVPNQTRRARNWEWHESYALINMIHSEGKNWERVLEHLHAEQHSVTHISDPCDGEHSEIKRLEHEHAARHQQEREEREKALQGCIAGSCPTETDQREVITQNMQMITKVLAVVSESTLAIANTLKEPTPVRTEADLMQGMMRQQQEMLNAILHFLQRLGARVALTSSSAGIVQCKGYLLLPTVSDP